MQQTGTLRKRKRRAINKVTGLGIIEYNEGQDNYQNDIFGIGGTQNYGKEMDRKFSTSNGEHTSLWFTAKNLLQHRRQSEDAPTSRNRVTRNARFHYDAVMDEELNGDEMLENNGEFEVKQNTLEQRTVLPECIKDRSHYLDKCTMQRLRLIIWLGSTSGAFPWKWNAKEYRIDNWGSTMTKLWKLQWFFLTIQTLCLTAFQIYSFYHTANSGAKTHRQIFQNSLSVLWYLWHVLYNLNMYLYKDAIREYINTMLRFNSQCVQKYVIHLNGNTDGGWYVIRVAILTSISQVFETVSLFLTIPFAPWFLFSRIYPKPFYWLIPGALQEYCLTGQVITSYILIGWILVTHANTVQFWLKEMHNNNETDFTIDELRSPKTSIEMYKSLQILCQCFNNCMFLAVPMIKFQMFAAIVVCGYVLIRSMNHIFVDEFPAIISYPIGVLDTTSMSFILMNLCAGIFDLGCSFIDSWSRTKHKDFRRVLMSCPTLKVWVGKLYTVTISTTLTFFQVTFGYITDAIITFP